MCVLVIAVFMGMALCCSSQWTTYTDTITAVCTLHNLHNPVLLFRITTNCINKQIPYLKCVEHAVFVSNKTNMGQRRTAYRITYSKPCGWIEMSGYGRVRKHFPLELSWMVRVPQYFYVNLTFYQFNLAMPSGRCSELQSSEIFILKVPVRSLMCSFFENPNKDITLCGKRTDFSLIWKCSRLEMIYIGLPMLLERGKFVIHYQVCNPRDCRMTATVKHVNPASSLPTRTFHNWPSLKLDEEHVLYSIHYLGLRSSVITLTFQKLPKINRESRRVIIDGFEGPGSAEVHRRYHIQDFTQKTDLQFKTFQAFLMVICATNMCENLQISHKLVSIFTTKSDINYINHTGEEVNLALPVLAANSSPLIYTAYIIRLDDVYSHSYLTVMFDEIRFSGPDYLGDYPEDNCLLYGVTVSDEMGYGSFNPLKVRSDFAYDGALPLRDALQVVVPQMTICYKVPKERSAIPGETNISYELPLKAFTSTTACIVVIIYMYGGYVDVAGSKLALRVRKTPCLGLYVSCPSSYLLGSGDAFLQLRHFNPDTDRPPFEPFSILSGAKYEICNGENILLYTIKTDALPPSYSTIRLVACIAKGGTEIHIISEFREINLVSRPCLMVYNNPFVDHEGRHRPCRLQIYELDRQLQHYKVIEVTDVITLWRLYQLNGYMEGKRMGGFGEKQFKNIPRNRSHTLSIFRFNYLLGRHDFSIEIVTPCTPVTRLSTLDNASVMKRRSTTVSTLVCPRYVISSEANATYFITVPQAPGFRAALFVFKVQSINILSRYLLMHHNAEAAGSRLSLILSSISKKCGLNVCKHVKLNVGYENLQGQLEIITWNLQLENDFAVVSLTQLTLGNWLVYLKHEPLENIKVNDCKCIFQIHVKRKALPRPCNQFDHYCIRVSKDFVSEPFASYSYFWTPPRQHSWSQAGRLCESMNMTLASIASEIDFQLVQHMMSGQAFLREDGTSDIGLLPPCRIENKLCMVYIGLTFEVGN